MGGLETARVDSAEGETALLSPLAENRPGHSGAIEPSKRVRAIGKHLHLDHDRFVVRGVTYGSFRARRDGLPFPEPCVIRSDMDRIARLGLNTVRIYQTPCSEILDLAAEHGLRLIIGLDYPDWRMEPEPGRRARRRVRDAGLRSVDEALSVCADRPEVLAISVGNEVPGDLVRVHGIGHVEDTLSELVDAVHRGDREMLVTYTNYPTTEYLEIADLDLLTFNVFLEDGEAFARYLQRLQVRSGQLPLVITEVGLAADVHGADAQAALLDQQLRTIDASGCAGATVFSWTDEWAVADQAVEGWGFGVTDVYRNPKPAVHALRSWTARELKDLRTSWPRVSVIVCAYNEEATIEECLTSLERCDYPDLEVIVCDDGSSDRTREISRRFPFRILELEHAGLSNARNSGISAATGDIVAFLDADATCHPQWPWFLVLSFDDEAVAAVGGPNLPFADAGLVERAVALSPGAPTEVLVSDDRAEHVAGCNMAFLRDHLVRIRGFDPVYTSAGDDVDVCWKLLDDGLEIGFSPPAQVIHHRRATVRGYLRQQRGYGRAEKLLSGAHPHRFNAFGQARWSGFIYGGVGLLPSLLRPVVYHGHQGQAAFQGVSGRRAESVATLITALLPLGAPVALFGLVASLLSPWFLLAPAAVVLSLMAYVVAIALSTPVARNEPNPLLLRSTVGLLHLLQPWVRTWGRLRGERPSAEAAPREWTGDRVAWLQGLERSLRCRDATVRRGGVTDCWDLEARKGVLLSCRITTGVAWGWVPHLATSYRPRRLATICTGCVVLVAPLSPALAAMTGIGLVAVSLIEAVRLRRVVASAICATSRGTT